MCEDLFAVIRSPFGALDAAFRRLTSASELLAIDGAEIGGGLPARVIPLDELRDLLLSPATSYSARDAAVRVLLRRAQTGDEADVVGLVGVLLPGLASAAAPLLHARPDLGEDLQSEILGRLLAIIPAFDPAQDRLAARLIRRATRAGYRLLESDRCHRSHAPLPEVLVTPPTPPTHPDFLLGQAVASGVLRPDEAELIAQTRISGVSVRTLATNSRQEHYSERSFAQ